jgi:hypothetical protein
VFLEGESGSGKSALIRAGLLPKLKDDKSILPLLLKDWWVDGWDRSPFKALKDALTTSGAVASDATAKLSGGQPRPGTRRLSELADVEQELTRLNDEENRAPLIIFDQFDDYQVRNRERFLPNKTWLDPVALRQSNPPLCLGRCQERLYTDDIHDAREIIGEYVQGHLGRNPRQAFHQKMRRAHPRLERAEGMLSHLAARVDRAPAARRTAPHRRQGR